MNLFKQILLNHPSPPPMWNADLRPANLWIQSIFYGGGGPGSIDYVRGPQPIFCRNPNVMEGGWVVGDMVAVEWLIAWLNLLFTNLI